MSDQPISLSRADRRKFEKAMRRAPRASRQKPSRASSSSLSESRRSHSTRCSSYWWRL